MPSSTSAPTVNLTADPGAGLGADGLLVPGVGNFHACMAGLIAAQAPRLIDVRLAGGRPVLGVCVGMQVLFDSSEEPSPAPLAGIGEWPGRVARLPAEIVPHMGWNTVAVPPGSRLFAGVEQERFYFVHSYAALTWDLAPAQGALAAVTPLVTTCDYGTTFVAGVENGPLTATQFHPEKSGDAGLHLLENWVRSL